MNMQAKPIKLNQAHTITLPTSLVLDALIVVGGYRSKKPKTELKRKATERELRARIELAR